MNNFNIKTVLLCSFIGLTVLSCNVPKATVTQDNIKKELPSQYQEKASEEKNSGITPWREFFTDPKLVVLIETALKNNQELLITLQQIEIAKSNVLYKKGNLLPTVSAQGGVGVNKVGRYTSEGAGNASTDIKPGKRVPEPLMNYDAGLTADWEVDIWNKLHTERQSAIEHYLATMEGKNFVLSTLIAEVANSYYELLALDNQLDIIHQYVELQKKALEIAKVQKEAAADTELAVKKFEAELAKAGSTEYTIKQKIVETGNTLNMLLGRYPAPIDRDKSTFMNIVPKVVYTGIPSELLSNRPDIKQAELELKSAKLDVQAARKEFYPTLNISASFGLEAFNPSYLTKMPESLTYSLIGGLAAPLINKTAIQAKFQSANAQQIAALYEYDKTILSAYLDVTNLISNIKNIDQYYQLKNTEADTLDKSTEIVDQLFQNSRATYLEVLMTQRDALDAKMELIEAKQQQLSNVVNIYKSLGGGWR